jgi:hypothetical protein
MFPPGRGCARTLVCFSLADDIHLHVSPDQFLKHLVHQALVSGSGIPQLERHYLITIQSLVGNEGSLLLIYLVHLYLIVLEKCIHEAEELVP